MAISQFPPQSAPQSAVISNLVQQQRQFFLTGKTRDLTWRREQLNRLKQAISEQEAAIFQALQADLHKSPTESYLGEISLVQAEIQQALRHLKQWSKPRWVVPPLSHWPALGQVQPEPLGVVLILGAWNYPLQLALAPLVAALAAGNCAIVKPSELAVQTSALVAKLLGDLFPPDYVAVVEGAKETSQQLLQEPFDHIFFTGSAAIGKQVMAAAAHHLTPVTLELGGKSPCIVEPDVPVETTARRIAWGKFFNGGQTCIAPDYLLVHRSIKQPLMAAIQRCVTEFYGPDPAKSPDYGRIINRRHFDRLCGLLESGQVVMGGVTQAEDLYIAPTLLAGVTWDDPVMQEEIFGPILPVLEYEDLSDAIGQVRRQPKPLTLYFFSPDSQKQQRMQRETSSGSIGFNDTLLQCSVLDLPFGGVGASGMGRYRGKAGFEQLSHSKSVLYRPFWGEVKLRYAPYGKKLSLFKRLL